MLLTPGRVQGEHGAARHIDAVNSQQRLSVPSELEGPAPLPPLELLVDLGPAQRLLDHGGLDVGQVHGQHGPPHQSEVPTPQNLQLLKNNSGAQRRPEVCFNHH